MNLINESQFLISKAPPRSFKVNFRGRFYSKILEKLICSFYAEKEGNWRCKESVVLSFAFGEKKNTTSTCLDTYTWDRNVWGG